jgi:hypothetical protein
MRPYGLVAGKSLLGGKAAVDGGALKIAGSPPLVLDAFVLFLGRGEVETSFVRLHFRAADFGSCEVCGGRFKARWVRASEAGIDLSQG